MDKLNEKELADAFSDSVNKYGFDDKVFAEQFKRQHRTLQQSMMRAMLTCIKAAADEENYHYDGRNESTHKVCKEIVQLWKDKHGDADINYLQFV